MSDGSSSSKGLGSSAVVGEAAGNPPALPKLSAAELNRNMNALMVGGELGSAHGVVGYHFGETRLPSTKSAAEFDERGVRIKSVDPAAATQGLKPKGMQGDPGEAYRAVSAKLEEKRQADMAAAALKAAEAEKADIVRQIRGGSTDPTLHTTLARLNKDNFNLPPDHTGY